MNDTWRFEAETSSISLLSSVWKLEKRVAVYFSNGNEMEILSILLAISSTLNINIFLYILPTCSLQYFNNETTQKVLGKRLIHGFKTQPFLLQKVISDFVFSLILFIFGVFILVQNTINNHLFEQLSDHNLQLALTIQLGNRIFRLLAPLTWPRGAERCFTSTCYGLLIIFSNSVILMTKENALFGLVCLISEGSVLWGDLLWVERRRHKCACVPLKDVALLLGNLVATIALRLITSTVLLAVSCDRYNFLRLSYVSLSTIIFDIVFYYVITVGELVYIIKKLYIFFKNRQHISVRRVRTTLPNTLTLRTTLNNLDCVDSDVTQTTHALIGQCPSDHSNVIKNF